jgi:hypothetical protein
MICLSRFGSKEPSPRWGDHKGRVYSNPFLSQSVTQTDRVFLFNHLGHYDLARITTQLGVSC